MEKINTKNSDQQILPEHNRKHGPMGTGHNSGTYKGRPKTQDSKHERASQIPYGWTLAQDGKTLLENETEQRAISLVRNLKAKGFSLRAICRELERKGYQPVGKQWHPKTISSILKRAARGKWNKNSIRQWGGTGQRHFLKGMIDWSWEVCKIIHDNHYMMGEKRRT
jgi:hypothetical protein